ncbi:hypothetical protein Q3G72_000395 [Acer saccharum]|nr:hypothetical protein Q3G72_000395 [Acer saccharum]
MGNYLTMLDPRVDMNVFNHHNHNLLDIMVANNSIWLLEMMRPDFQKKCFYYCTKILSWLPEKLLFIQPLSLNPGLRMIVSENDNIGEGKDEGNRVSKSKDGEVEDEGNRMSSKSNGGKGEDRSMFCRLQSNIYRVCQYSSSGPEKACKKHDIRPRTNKFFYGGHDRGIRFRHLCGVT